MLWSSLLSVVSRGICYCDFRSKSDSPASNKARHSADREQSKDRE